MRRMDELHMDYPFYGSRQMMRHLRREGVTAGRHRIRRLMAVMGMEATYRRPRTSVANSEHRIFPYLLRDLEISRTDHVWCADITYIPVTQGFFYLVAVMDWATRHVLSWRLSNTMDASFCIGALDDALVRATPEILNTEFTQLGAGVAFSMDGRGRFRQHLQACGGRCTRPCTCMSFATGSGRSSARGSTSTTRCARTRRWAGGRQARPTATARGRCERRISVRVDGRLGETAGSGGPCPSCTSRADGGQTTEATATLFLVCNPHSVPRMNLEDDALASRLRELPYPAVPDDQKDPELPGRLRTKEFRRAMLARLVSEASKRRPGYPPKDIRTVSEATEARIDDDIGELGRFARRFVPTSSTKLAFPDVWKEWCEMNGVQDPSGAPKAGGITRRSFTRLLRKQVPALPETKSVSIDGKTVRGWVGWELRPDDTSQV